MALNIKNDDAQRLTRELADATGESLTTAVTTAVRERLDRVRADDVSPAQRAQRILALGRQIADALPVDGMQVDDLYNDAGLPA